jgi:hypothetical protein
MNMNLFLNYIKDKQTNNFEMTSFSNERRSNSYLKPKSLYTEDWNSDARGAISRGLHKKPFESLTSEERHQLGVDSKHLGTHEGFVASDEHFDDPHFVRGMQGKPFRRMFTSIPK